jgi:threonine dehydratase
MAGYATVAK